MTVTKGGISMITMENIVREGHPALRTRAEKFAFPLSEEEKQLAHDMMEFLENSQNEELAEKYGLRAGVGLAAPQLGITKQMIALLVPGEYEDDEPLLKGVWVNPRIIRESVQKTCLREGEGCLSVDREVPGVVVRPNKITVHYFDVDGNKYSIQLEGYEAIVVQHEIDHLHGVMFYDHINPIDPTAVPDGVIALG